MLGQQRANTWGGAFFFCVCSGCVCVCVCVCVFVFRHSFLTLPTPNSHHLPDLFFCYSEGKLWDSLAMKYKDKVKPFRDGSYAAASPPTPATSLSSSLSSFYLSIGEKDKAGSAGETAKKYVGSEGKLWDTLAMKYGAEKVRPFRG